MDARCGQVYNALFREEGGELIRLTEDRALSIRELEQECQGFGSGLLLLGDGAALCHKTFSPWGARLAPPATRFQRPLLWRFWQAGRTAPPWRPKSWCPPISGSPKRSGS